MLAACLLAALATPCRSAAQDAASFFTLHELAPGVVAAISMPGSGAGGNAGFVIGDGGVAVVDTFQSAAAAEALLAAIRARTSQPIRFVVDTHYHIDHVAGNGVFRAAGATIVAQRNVRAWERSENLKFWQPDVPPDKRAWIESLTLPDLTYDATIDLYLGARRLRLEVFPGHTGGDSIVVVPDADVVFTGDLFWNTALPNTIDADTAAWTATLERLRAGHPRATFVPGHGQVGKAGQLEAFDSYLEALRGEVAAARGRGLEGDPLVAAVRAALAPRYSDWSYFEHFVAANVNQTAAELAGTKRRPQPVE